MAVTHLDEHHTRAPISRDQWLGVELRHLAALAAVANERSFSAAAERLGYVQSAVSQQISCLERLVGARLFERSRGPAPVSLTEAGELLLAHADAVLDQLRHAHMDLEALMRVGDTRLNLGATPESSSRIVPAVLARVRARHPGVTVTVREAGTEKDLFALLAARELDAVLADLPPEPALFAHEALVCDSYVLLAPKDAPVTRCSPAQLPAALAAQPLIGRRHCRSITGLNDRLHAHGLDPHWVLHTDVHATLPALVDAGVGCAVVPRLTLDPSWRGLAVVGLDELVEPRVLALFWRSEVEEWPSLATFRAETRAACADLRAA